MLRNTAYLFGSRVASSALALIMGAVVLRVLGPAGQGDYAQLLSWIGVFVTVFGFSGVHAIFHFSNETAYSITRNQLAGSALALWALAMLLSAGGVCLAPVLWPGIFSASFTANLGLVLLVVAAQLGAGLLLALVRVANAFRLLSLSLLASQIIMVLAIGLLALLGSLNITTLLLFTGISQLFLIGCAGWHLYYSGWLPPRVDPGLLGGLFKAGLKTHAATIAGQLYIQFDQIWVRAVAGEEQTGLYNVAVTIAMQLMLLPMTIQEVLYPRIMQTDPKDEAATMITVTKFAFFIFLGCLVIVLGLAWPMVMVLAGAQYERSVNLLRLLLPGILCFSIPNLLSPYWVKKGHFVLASATALFLLAVNFLLNYLWITPDNGAEGAAWATDVTYITAFLLSLVMFYALSGHNPLHIFWITRQDITSVVETLATLMPKKKAVLERH